MIRNKKIVSYINSRLNKKQRYKSITETKKSITILQQNFSNQSFENKTINCLDQVTKISEQKLNTPKCYTRSWETI